MSVKEEKMEVPLVTSVEGSIEVVSFDLSKPVAVEPLSLIQLGERYFGGGGQQPRLLKDPRIDLGFVRRAGSSGLSLIDQPSLTPWGIQVVDWSRSSELDGVGYEQQKVFLSPEYRWASATEVIAFCIEYHRQKGEYPAFYGVELVCADLLSAEWIPEWYRKLRNMAASHWRLSVWLDAGGGGLHFRLISANSAYRPENWRVVVGVPKQSPIRLAEGGR